MYPTGVVHSCSGIIEQYVPRHMRAKVQPEDIRRKHRELLHLSMNDHDADEAFMGFVRQWRLYGATIFDVVQGYTAMLPKNLWLAVDEHGIHILKRRDKVTHTYTRTRTHTHIHTYSYIHAQTHMYIERQRLKLHMVGKKGGRGNGSEPDQHWQPQDLKPTL